MCFNRFELPGVGYIVVDSVSLKILLSFLLSDFYRFREWDEIEAVWKKCIRFRNTNETIFRA